MAWVGASVSRSLTRLQSRCQPRPQSHLKAQVWDNPLLSSLTLLLEGFISSPDIGSKVSAPHWPLARSLLQVLAVWASPRCSSQHGRLLCSKQTSKKPEQGGSQYFGTLILKVTSYHFHCILSIRSKSLGFSPLSRGGGYTAQG